MCDEVELTNSTSGSMVLLQGRYALIPYTHRPVVGGSVEFVLNMQVGAPPPPPLLSPPSSLPPPPFPCVCR